MDIFLEKVKIISKIFALLISVFLQKSAAFS